MRSYLIQRNGYINGPRATTRSCWLSHCRDTPRIISVISGPVLINMMIKCVFLLASSYHISYNHTASYHLMAREQRTKMAHRFNSLRPPRRNGRHFEDDIFKRFFLYWLLYLNSNFTEICFQRSILQDNGMALNSHQDIIWGNGGIVYSRIYSSLGFGELVSNYCKVGPILTKLTDG